MVAEITINLRNRYYLPPRQPSLASPMALLAFRVADRWKSLPCAGKVKCIYIDPPYNTGNEGWVYN